MTLRTRSRATAPMCLMAAVALITLAACGSSTTKAAPTTTVPAATAAPSTAAPSTAAPSTAAAATAAPAAGANSLTIKNFSFGALTVKAGASIAIVNADPADHTVTADNGTFDIAATAGKTTSLVIAKAGSYAIHCKIHASMHGTITVT